MASDMTAYRDISGDEDADYQSLVLIVSHFSESYNDFNDDPSTDAVADISGWTQCFFAFCTRLESAYGHQRTKALIGAAWREVRE